MKSLKRIFAIFWRQVLLLKGNPFRPLNLFYFSALELFLWGVLTLYLDRVSGSGFHFVSLVLGAVIMSSFMSRVVFGVSASFLEDVWTRNFINLFSSPLSLHEYILGFVAVSIVESSLSVGFMALLAWMLIAYNIFSFGLMLIPFAAILFIFGLAVGIVATAVVLRFGPSAEMVVWSIPPLLAPFSAVFYPLSALPSVVLTGSFETKELIIGFVLALCYCAIAYFLLHRSYQSVLRRGLFARFATE
ncbi:MAG: hypothetical protein Greene071436_306 [Parcubacteria group bacterium Greene0714_36]|nr:MAG: hypothetical protein Greene071436_306 [Parcubacteria group bacterium Greene0714_36]